MKNVLTNERINSIVSRANRLLPNMRPMWGTMSVTAMLYHCSLINNSILSQATQRTPKLKERLLKPVLYVLKKLPQGIKTGDKFLPPSEDKLTFEKERAAYLQSVERLISYPNEIMGSHPIFGPLNTNEWRKFLWLHLDHHLRQFGV